MKKIMKTLVLLVCVASFGLITSCQKDYENLIVGKWKLEQVLRNGVEEPDYGYGIGGIYEFTEDGVLKRYTPDGKLVFAFPYSVSDKTLYIDAYSGMNTTIETLNKKTLCFSWTHYYDGTSVYYKNTFSRI